MQKTGLKWKIVVINIFSTLAIVIILNTFVLYKLENLEQKNFKNSLYKISSDYANDMKFEWSIQYGVGKIIQNGLVDLWEQGKANRTNIENYLYNIFKKDKHAFAIGFAVLPNSLDGKDAFYKGKPGYSKTGCFNPYYYRDDAGEIIKTQWYRDFVNQPDFAVPMKTKKDFVQNPFLFNINSQNRFVMSMSFPVIVDGEVKGVIKLQNDITGLFENLMAANPYGAGKVAIIGNDGEIICHPQKEKRGKMIKDLSEFPLVKSKEDFLKSLHKKEPNMHKEKGKIVFSYPIDIEGLDTQCSILMKIDANLLETDEMKFAVVIQRFFLLMVVLSMIISYFVASSISKPLEGLNAMIVDLSQGEGDLTQEIHIESNDEIEEIGNNTNIFVAHLHNIVQQIKISMNALNSVSYSLASSTDEAGASIEQINKNLENIGNEVQQLVNSLDSNKNNQLFLTKSMKEIADGATEQSQVINSSSLAIEQMSDSIKSVYENTCEKIKLVETVQKKTKDSSSYMAMSLEAIKAVQDSANTIRELLAVIEDVANQTNLLAMNAAIEAAHAGEAGKGFAVVADEIRKLATNSTHSSAQMDKSITVVLNNIAKTGNSFKETNSYFQEMLSDVQEVTDTMFETRDAMTKLSSGSESIVSSLVQINTSSSDLADKSQKMREVMKEQNRILKDNECRLENLNSGFIEVNIGMKEILQTVLVVKSSGVKNSENITGVSELVERFKTRKK